MIHSIQLIYVAKLVHAIHARLHGGHLREGAIATQEQTHPLHGPHVLRIESVGQTHQGIVVAKGQLLGSDIDKGFELSSRYHHGYGFWQEISQFRAEAGEGLLEREVFRILSFTEVYIIFIKINLAKF